MPEGVRVNINDATVISCLNTPGGLIYEWRNAREREVLDWAFTNSPVNDELNAVHRPLAPPPGTYKASWVTKRQGNGHRIGFQIENFADHAIFVEEDRSGSTKIQVFSWTGWDGDIRAVGFPWQTGTKRRDGRHVLRNAANYVGAKTGDWSPLI